MTNKQKQIAGITSLTVMLGGLVIWNKQTTAKATTPITKTITKQKVSKPMEKNCDNLKFNHQTKKWENNGKVVKHNWVGKNGIWTHYTCDKVDIFQPVQVSGSSTKVVAQTPPPSIPQQPLLIPTDKDSSVVNVKPIVIDIDKAPTHNQKVVSNKNWPSKQDWARVRSWALAQPSDKKRKESAMFKDAYQRFRTGTKLTAPVPKWEAKGMALIQGYVALGASMNFNEETDNYELTFKDKDGTFTININENLLKKTALEAEIKELTKAIAGVPKNAEETRQNYEEKLIPSGKGTIKELDKHIKGFDKTLEKLKTQKASAQVKLNKMPASPILSTNALRKRAQQEINELTKDKFAMIDRFEKAIEKAPTKREKRLISQRLDRGVNVYNQDIAEKGVANTFMGGLHTFAQGKITANCPHHREYKRLNIKYGREDILSHIHPQEPNAHIAYHNKMLNRVKRLWEAKKREVRRYQHSTRANLAREQAKWVRIKKQNGDTRQVEKDIETLARTQRKILKKLKKEKRQLGRYYNDLNVWTQKVIRKIHKGLI